PSATPSPNSSSKWSTGSSSITLFFSRRGPPLHFHAPKSYWRLAVLFLLLPRFQLFKPVNPAASQREENPPNDSGSCQRNQKQASKDPQQHRPFRWHTDTISVAHFNDSGFPERKHHAEQA